MNTSSEDLVALLDAALAKFHSGDMQGAKSYCDQVIALVPTQPDALNLLAVLARGAKKWGKAEEIARFGRAKNPQHAQLANTLGLVLLDRRRAAEAEAEFRHAHDLKPERPEYLSNLGLALQALYRWEEAQQVYTDALDLNPDFSLVRAARAAVSADLGDFTGAKNDIEHAIKSNPDDPEILACAARFALSQGDLDASYNAFSRTVDLTPHVADARVNRGLIRMLQGRIGEGWDDYCQRRYRRWARPSARHLEMPEWQGEALTGKTILVWCEQGLGEAILCASLLPQLADEAEHVVLECAPRLADLFSRSFPQITVVAEQTPAHPKIASAGADVQAPIFDLVGHRARDAVQRSPGPPFLQPDAAQVAALRSRYKNDAGDRPLIGLSWASPKAMAARHKGIAAEDWLPILATPDVAFVNLQYGQTRLALADVAAQCNAMLIDDASIDPGGNLSQVADQIAALDLVITVSNTTAHIAGGLGKETWVLVPPLGLGSMWFWFMEGEASPWYKSVRLLRRKMNEDEAVIANVTARLSQWITAWDSSPS